MGISQLLPFLEKSTRPCHVSEFRGRTVAVDSYCWLHKGARSCALELAKGENSHSFITYCLKYVNMLLSYDIKPIMVFDGRHLPAKLKTEERRRDQKKQARQQGVEMLRLGKVDEAYKFFKQCVDISPEMALGLIKECRKLHVDCIVAPYESDAQLAFFSLKGIADCIISEDSDLLLFGCNKVLYKMDLSGSGQLVEADKIHQSMRLRPEQYTFDKFRHMCVLSGCDYLDSLPGIGLKKALKFIAMTAETDPELFLDKLPRYLNMRHLTVSMEYKENFLIADATFQFQVVYDPINRTLTRLNTQGIAKHCKNAGEVFDQNEAYQLALGNLDPLTMKKVDNWEPNNNVISEHSIWSRCYCARPLKPAKNVKRNSISVNVVDPKTIELARKQHDQQIEKELEFYKKPCPVVEKDDSDLPPEGDQKISPVLGEYSTNPFVKRKKFSKFDVTEVNPKQVISRFFSSAKPTSSEDNLIDGESDACSLSNSDETMTMFETVDVESPDACLEDDLNVTSELPNVDCDYEYVPIVECDCIIEEDDLILEEPALTSVENFIEPDSKKRKLEKARANTGKRKKQLSIFDMFKNMKSH